MLIVKKGEPPSFPIWEGTCIHCNSELLASQEEVKRIDKWSLMGEIKCPVCKYIINFRPRKDKRPPPGFIPW